MLSDQMALSIGGSGARCAEAFVYLCAAGLGPPSATLIFIDADTQNHSLQRALEVARLYERLQPTEPIYHASSPFLQTHLSTMDPPVWTPFPEGIKSPTLESHFEYAKLAALQAPGQGAGAILMDALYSLDQRKAVLDIGFRGKPSIGAALFADRLNAESSPWSEIIPYLSEATASNRSAKVFGMGSVFGGTGAAGLPTIPRLIRDRVQPGSGSIRFGALLLLPYFTFAPPPEATRPDVFASPALFQMNSREALRYYEEHGDFFSDLYVLGTSELSNQPKFALGGKDQANAPHFVELLGGLAAARFFKTEAQAPRKAHFVATQRLDQFGWHDVPDSAQVQPALNNFARMCLFYLVAVFPRLKSVHEMSRSAQRTAWYRDLVLHRQLTTESTENWTYFLDLRTFCLRYLTWLRDMQRNVVELKLSLVKEDILGPLSDDQPSILPDRFDGDLLYQGLGSEANLGVIWRNLCHLSAPPRAFAKLPAHHAFQATIFEAATVGRR